MFTNEIDIFLKNQGFSDETIDDFLEHFGVLGQKWGVRRAYNKSERQHRLRSGKETRKDKIIKSLDLDRTNPKQRKANSQKIAVLTMVGLSAATTILQVRGLQRASERRLNNIRNSGRVNVDDLFKNMRDNGSSWNASRGS